MKTCGEFYLDALTKHTGGDERLVEAFAAGFVNGQAEKVYLGACPAAMFRPSPDRAVLIDLLVQDTCQRYGLKSYLSASGEVWIGRDKATLDEIVFVCREVESNTPRWHRRRALLCGIPENEIDHEFHKRKMFNQPCDVVTQEVRHEH